MYNLKQLGDGAVSGVIAGILVAFFLILAEKAYLLANLMGVLDKVGGLLVHFALCLFAGIVFALLLGWLIHSWWSAIFLGLIFGFALWIIGSLTLFPSITKGAPLFSHWTISGIKENHLSLIAHLVYGFILGLGFCFLKKGKLHKLKKPAKYSIFS